MKNQDILKRSILSVLSVLFISVLFAQSPGSFNYQALARDVSGDELANQNIGVFFRIRVGNAFGPQVYAESHNTNTNAHGLFSVPVGGGTPSYGIFSSIDWSNGPYFLEVRYDPAGGVAYLDMGTQQLLSVPYALFAKNSTGANELSDADDDTKVQVEESADEDIIRFDVAGFQKWSMAGSRLESNNTGESIFIGLDAGVNDDLSTNRNVFIGHSAGYANTTGSNNTGVGWRALVSNIDGSGNAAYGRSALISNGSGNSNSAFGYLALSDNTSGDGNCAFGEAALDKSNGNNNVAVGYRSQYTASSSGFNTSVGYRSLQGNGTGFLNTAVGADAMFNNSSGAYNTAIGRSANSVGVAYDNTTGLGDEADPTASNSVHVGNIFVTSIKGQVGFTTYSDARFKKNIKDSEVKGLEFITKLRPVTYNYDTKAYSNWKEDNYGEKDDSDWEGKYDIEQIRFSGFLAQEVEETAKELGYDFSGVDAPKNAKDTYGLRYAEFVVPLVKGMQEQQEMIEELKKTVADLQARLAALEQ